MAGIVEGRVVIVTGAARGIGRGHALEFARQGAKVVVNDLGAEADGSGASTGPAGEVVGRIRAEGGEAIANGDDVSDWDGAERLINAAVEHFGDLHVLVNNAGILRDRMLVNVASAGLPKDGDPRAGYAIFTAREGGWEVKHRRVVFDVKKVATQLADCGIPESAELIATLRRHRYKRLKGHIP